MVANEIADYLLGYGNTTGSGVADLVRKNQSIESLRTRGEQIPTIAKWFYKDPKNNLRPAFFAMLSGAFFGGTIPAYLLYSQLLEAALLDTGRYTSGLTMEAAQELVWSQHWFGIYGVATMGALVSASVFYRIGEVTHKAFHEHANTEAGNIAERAFFRTLKERGLPVPMGLKKQREWLKKAFVQRATSSSSILNREQLINSIGRLQHAILKALDVESLSVADKNVLTAMIQVLPETNGFAFRFAKDRWFEQSLLRYVAVLDAFMGAAQHMRLKDRGFDVHAEMRASGEELARDAGANVLRMTMTPADIHSNRIVELAGVELISEELLDLVSGVLSSPPPFERLTLRVSPISVSIPVSEGNPMGKYEMRVFVTGTINGKEVSLNKIAEFNDITNDREQLMQRRHWTGAIHDALQAGAKEWFEANNCANKLEPQATASTNVRIADDLDQEDESETTKARTKQTAGH